MMRAGPGAVGDGLELVGRQHGRRAHRRRLRREPAELDRLAVDDRRAVERHRERRARARRRSTPACRRAARRRRRRPRWRRAGPPCGTTTRSARRRRGRRSCWPTRGSGGGRATPRAGGPSSHGGASSDGRRAERAPGRRPARSRPACGWPTPRAAAPTDVGRRSASAASSTTIRSAPAHAAGAGAPGPTITARPRREGRARAWASGYARACDSRILTASVSAAALVRCGVIDGRSCAADGRRTDQPPPTSTPRCGCGPRCSSWSRTAPTSTPTGATSTRPPPHLWLNGDDGTMAAYVRVLTEPDGTLRHRPGGHRPGAPRRSAWPAGCSTRRSTASTGPVVLDAQSHLTARLRSATASCVDGDRVPRRRHPPHPDASLAGADGGLVGSRRVGRGLARRGPAPPRSARPHALGATRRGRRAWSVLLLGVARGGGGGVAASRSCSSPAASRAGRPVRSGRLASPHLGARPAGPRAAARRGRAPGHVDPLRAHPADRRGARARSSGCSASRSSSCARRPPPPTPTSTGCRRATPTGSGSSCSTSPASMTSSELPPPPPPPPPDGPWVAGPPPTRRAGADRRRRSRTSPLTDRARGASAWRSSALTLAVERAARRQAVDIPGIVIGFVFTLQRTVGWWFRTYTVTDAAVILDEGMLQRRHRVVPFSRIQQVELRQQLTVAAVRDRDRPHRDGRRRRRHGHQPAVPRLPAAEALRDHLLAEQRRVRAGHPGRGPATDAGAQWSGRLPRTDPHGAASRLRPASCSSPGSPSSGAIVDGRRSLLGDRAAPPSIAGAQRRRPARRCSWRPRRHRLGGVDLPQRLGVRPHRFDDDLHVSRGCSTVASTRCRATASSTSG